MFWPKQLPGTVSLLWLLLCLLYHSQNADGFIVPEQVPSVLSLVYSNIPTIKKGTDSRFGFGFRLGEHADFQVLLELGPQKETRPLGDPSKYDQSFNKRQVSAQEQRQHLRQQQLLATSTERNAASWLETWSNGMKPQEKVQTAKPKPRSKQTEAATLPVRPQMPTDALQQLQQLYKMASTVSEASTTTTTTSEAPSSTGASLSLGVPSGFKLPPPVLAQDSNALGVLSPKKSSADITKDLMNVSLEA
ncbi:uncharacterized protein LOC133850405 isoform X1 [Drosophila sulfurigaster albostrigata]|uniref:uncharacterized protein LOC133850405 isoform X1 n=1 Tax=Drosophila sulfurigaster albostrigata TaxID=89887 RepID=UPI002D21E2FE|nr:uncharacterized protein LOC133850405 isoform X1 [Drosophila sulfurigaster albostrigata]XP_062142479.1 uncharacterized protein LOC133850405 isoform X1 [Drosophila sulfurigaster albostrigata]